MEPELAPYVGNSLYGWVAYFSEILGLLGTNGFDGLALHTYTHATDPKQALNEPWKIFSDSMTYRGGYTKAGRYDDFKCYIDFMSAVPAWARQLPVYITEMNPHNDVQSWPNVNAPWAWIKNAYREINSWNANPVNGNQKIRAAALYRWSGNDFNLAGLGDGGAVADFMDAMNNDYRWTSPACNRVALKAPNLNRFNDGTHDRTSANPKFLTAPPHGDFTLRAEAGHILDWEIYELIRFPQGGNKFAFKTTTPGYNKFVAAEPAGDGWVLRANRDQPREWETFELVGRGGTDVALRTWHGRYVRAVNGGGGAVVGDAAQIGPHETFELVCVS